MYKGKRSWFFLVSSIIFFLLYLFLLFSLKLYGVLSTPIQYLLISLLLLFEFIRNYVIRVTITDDSIQFRTLFKKGEVLFKSITSIKLTSFSKIIIFEADKKIVIPLELQNSALFLKEFQKKYKEKSSSKLDQEQYFKLLKRRAFKDQQNNRINLHLWKPIILTIILFFLSNLLTKTLTPFNIVRLIFILVLPITTFFLPEINFAFKLEKKSNIENDILTRNFNYEKKMYQKYFIYGLLALIVLMGSFWVL
ncbi:MAG: hypothetical protein U9P73_11165 [Candidatus Cloacimonadota bacterium]|nr:hypothetical protein [Candidatus Cloacimonadota bacterium]